MSDKPSYLGLLNALALGESAAHEYLEAWAAVTPSDEVRQVLLTVSAREGEHGKTFAKRINELGYNLKKKDDPGQADRMAIACSTELSDLEKMEKFGLGRQASDPSKPDVFAGFFNDNTIDIRTGELLGRYICEERDSGRLLQSCYQQLKAQANGGSSSASMGGDRLASLESKIDQICETVDQLCQVVTAQAGMANGNGKKSKKLAV